MLAVLLPLVANLSQKRVEVQGQALCQLSGYLGHPLVAHETQVIVQSGREVVCADIVHTVIQGLQAKQNTNCIMTLFQENKDLLT